MNSTAVPKQTCFTTCLLFQISVEVLKEDQRILEQNYQFPYRMGAGGAHQASIRKNLDFSGVQSTLKRICEKIMNVKFLGYFFNSKS